VEFFLGNFKISKLLCSCSTTSHGSPYDILRNQREAVWETLVYGNTEFDEVKCRARVGNPHYRAVRTFSL
jgi:hypothetical protein